MTRRTLNRKAQRLYAEKENSPEGAVTIGVSSYSPHRGSVVCIITNAPVHICRHKTVDCRLTSCNTLGVGCRMAGQR